VCRDDVQKIDRQHQRWQKKFSRMILMSVYHCLSGIFSFNILLGFIQQMGDNSKKNYCIFFFNRNTGLEVNSTLSKGARV
jgi:hypothetical protein